MLGTCTFLFPLDVIISHEFHLSWGLFFSFFLSHTQTFLVFMSPPLRHCHPHSRSVIAPMILPIWRRALLRKVPKWVPWLPWQRATNLPSSFWESAPFRPLFYDSAWHAWLACIEASWRCPIELTHHISQVHARPHCTSQNPIFGAAPLPSVSALLAPTFQTQWLRLRGQAQCEKSPPKNSSVAAED